MYYQIILMVLLTLYSGKDILQIAYDKAERSEQKARFGDAVN